MSANVLENIFLNVWGRFTKELPLNYQLRFAPILAQIIVIRRCNIACGYCNEFDRDSEPVPQLDIFARIDKLSELGTVAIEFSGGEPLLHPHITDIISYATQKNFLRRMLITNGMLLTHEIIEKLNDSGLQHMQISIDGVVRNTITMKVLNNLRPQLKLLKKYAKFAVTINSVIGAAPAKEAEDVFHFSQAHGFTPRLLVVHDKAGQVNLQDEDLNLYHKLKKRISTSKAKKHYIDLLLSGEIVPFKCRAGSRYLYVDEFGKVRYCSQQMAQYEKPLLDFTAGDLRTNFYSYKNCNEKCTIGCARNCSSLDQWRSQNDLKATG